jgi:hypothetical protein
VKGSLILQTEALYFDPSLTQDAGEETPHNSAKTSVHKKGQLEEETYEQEVDFQSYSTSIDYQDITSVSLESFKEDK